MKILGVIFLSLLVTSLRAQEGPSPQEVMKEIQTFDASRVTNNYEALIEASGSLAAVFHREVLSGKPDLLKIKLSLQEADKALTAIEVLANDREYWVKWQYVTTSTQVVAGIGLMASLLFSAGENFNSPQLARAAFVAGGLFGVTIVADALYFEPKFEAVEKQLQLELGAAAVLLENVCHVHKWFKASSQDSTAELEESFPSLSRICGTYINPSKIRIGKAPTK